MVNKEIKLQGHKYRRDKVLSKWIAIVKFYEDKGAKETLEKFEISRSHLYYIIGQLNKKIN